MKAEEITQSVVEALLDLSADNDAMRVGATAAMSELLHRPAQPDDIGRGHELAFGAGLRILAAGLQRGHVEGYRLVRDDEVMRWKNALEVTRSALAGDHRSAGSACGVDACVLCWAQVEVSSALTAAQGGEGR